MKVRSDRKRILGDFQTPIDITEGAVKLIHDKGIHPEIIIEPTCGSGNFFLSVLRHYKKFPELKFMIGLEIQEHYRKQFRKSLADHNLEYIEESIKITDGVLPFENGIESAFVYKIKFSNNRTVEIYYLIGDFFTIQDGTFLRLIRTITPSGPQDSTRNNMNNDAMYSILIMGNPPWINTPELGRVSGKNIPKKSNIKKQKGLDAITGAGSFDIGEYVIIKLLLELAERADRSDLSLAMIVKTTVIFRIIRDLPKIGLCIGKAEAYTLDTKKAFGISAEGALFIMRGAKYRNGGVFYPSCTIFRHPYFYTDIKTELTEKTFGYSEDGVIFMSDLSFYADYKKYLGRFPIEWRQGVKHDARKIFILKKDRSGRVIKNDGTELDIEGKPLYPFIKGSLLNGGVITERNTNELILITQRTLGEDPAEFLKDSPKALNYLITNEHKLKSRKSRVYSKRPPFAIFGIGDYTFAPYKVAIYGFSKEPVFSLLIGEEKPLIPDDTAYFIPFARLEDAEEYYRVLNSEPIRNLLRALRFPEAKRPFNKSILMKIDPGILLKKE